MNQVENLDFVHLHVHSEYSLVDGIIRVNELVDHTVKLGYHSIALTDLTNLFGLIEFCRSARKQGIKPIVGSEVYVAKDKDSVAAPLVLLAKNKQGYINLTKLVSKAYVEGQVNGDPIVLFNWLEEFSEGPGFLWQKMRRSSVRWLLNHMNFVNFQYFLSGLYRYSVKTLLLQRGLACQLPTEIP